MESRTGATSGADLISVTEIRGLRDFRRELKAIGPEWPRELRKVNKEISTRAAGWARARATAHGGAQAKFADRIRGYANQRAARVGIATGNTGAGPTFWGAKRHTGWYDRARYNDSPPQHPPWVGNSWDAAVHGQGPYALNPALADHVDDIVDEYGDMLDELAHRAFPERGN
jgi:hypothetical protein